MDKYAPPRELWTAAKCAHLLGYRNAAAFIYASEQGREPKPAGYDGCSRVWLADSIRAAWIAKKNASK